MKGMDLSRAFFKEIVKPLLADFEPRLSYDAGLIGYGSDVIGMDTLVSRDHNWGPRLVIFLSDEEDSDQLDLYLQEKLPASFMGFEVNFSAPLSDGVVHMTPLQGDKVNHLIEITTRRKFEQTSIGPFIEDLQWPLIPAQALLELSSGEIFYGDLGHMQAMMTLYQNPPTWYVLLQLYILWDAVASEEAFLGRNREVEAPLGMSIISNRLLDYGVKMIYYILGKYPPYSKWTYKKLTTLPVPMDLLETLHQLISSEEPVDKGTGHFFSQLSKWQLARGLPGKELTLGAYYGRPYAVVHADQMAEQLYEHLPAFVKEDSYLLLCKMVSLNASLDLTDNLHTLWHLYKTRKE